MGGHVKLGFTGGACKTRFYMGGGHVKPKWKIRTKIFTAGALRRFDLDEIAIADRDFKSKPQTWNSERYANLYPKLFNNFLRQYLYVTKKNYNYFMKTARIKKKTLDPPPESFIFVLLKKT